MAWNNVEEVDVAKGIYAVNGELWSVGHRYKLQAHVGSGSYGDVCKAVDVEFNQIIALKRVPDVFFCQMLAKRVLREVCIMRRLSHPYIISLTDVFTMKNLDKSNSTDLYIATEFAELGDLYHQVEPPGEETVRLLIWQLLVAVRYMHSCHVWHRDIKSENVLLTAGMRVKLCDFGLSRSALETSSHVEPRSTGGKASRKKPVLVRQYTKTEVLTRTISAVLAVLKVVTPSHRAPEVVMSQGQYTCAIDVWSVGCIFWELLMRQSYPLRHGPPAKPLFGVRGEPSTPVDGELYTYDSTSQLHEQLDVIFDVIGTPCWKDIESVPSAHWRAYLKKVPGRAGNVVKRLSGLVNDNALDLLQRMLAFEPNRRCTADEALFHAYFKTVKTPEEVPPIPMIGRAPSVLPDHPVWKISEPAVALGLLERELEMSLNHVDGGKLKLEQLLQCEVEQQQLQNHIRRTAFLNLAKGLINRVGGPMPGPSVLQTPREIQLFPCVTSRATDTSVGSLKSNRPDLWSAEGVQEEPGWQEGPARGSTDSDLSQEPTGPAGTASAVAERVGVAPSDHPCEEERPSAKRQRTMMIRQGSLCIALDRGPEPLLPSRPGERLSNKAKSSNLYAGKRAQTDK